MQPPRSLEIHLKLIYFTYFSPLSTVQQPMWPPPSSTQSKQATRVSTQPLTLQNMVLMVRGSAQLYLFYVTLHRGPVTSGYGYFFMGKLQLDPRKQRVLTYNFTRVTASPRSSWRLRAATTKLTEGISFAAQKQTAKANKGSLKSVPFSGKLAHPVPKSPENERKLQSLLPEKKRK